MTTTSLLEYYFFPSMPALFILLLALFFWRKIGLSRWLFAGGTLIFCLMTMPIIAKFYTSGLLALAPFYTGKEKVDAIVVLTGGSYEDGTGITWPSESTIKRVAIGLVFAKQEPTVPFIVAGGCPKSPQPACISEAESAVRAFNLNDKKEILIEKDSQNSYETAVNVVSMLNLKPSSQVVVVTADTHVLRVVLCFRRLGIKALGVPVPTKDISEIGILDIIPSRKGLNLFTLATREYLGILGYWLEGRL